MVDGMHKALILWERGNQENLENFLATTGYGTNASFWLFCQAVAESLLYGTKEKQLLEGFLVGKRSFKKQEADKLGRMKVDDFLGR